MRYALLSNRDPRAWPIIQLLRFTKSPDRARLWLLLKIGFQICTFYVLESDIASHSLTLFDISFMSPVGQLTRYATLFSFIFLSSTLFPLTLFHYLYMLLFQCINSRPSWHSEIKWSPVVSLAPTSFRYITWHLARFSTVAGDVIPDLNKITHFLLSRSPFVTNGKRSTWRRTKSCSRRSFPPTSLS